jgi:hypothetical protein
LKRPLILTCSLCSHYEPNRSVCTLNGEHRNPLSTEEAAKCQRKGTFCRYMHVIPDAYNYYSIDEEIPGDWKMDLSKIPTDSKGIHLFISTKRGVEKAISANDSVKTLKGDMIFGVPKIFTYQGQRELIYEIGVVLAEKEAINAGIKLTVLPEEKGSKGIQESVIKHNTPKSTKKKKSAWLSEQPVEPWD